MKNQWKDSRQAIIAVNSHWLFVTDECTHSPFCSKCTEDLANEKQQRKGMTCPGCHMVFKDKVAIVVPPAAVNNWCAGKCRMRLHMGKVEIVGPIPLVAAFRLVRPKLTAMEQLPRQSALGPCLASRDDIRSRRTERDAEAALRGKRRHMTDYVKCLEDAGWKKRETQIAVDTKAAAEEVVKTRGRFEKSRLAMEQVISSRLTGMSLQTSKMCTIKP